MASNKGWAIFLIIFFGALLQSALIAADSRYNTPHQVAARFAEAYFKLDRSMNTYLCDELSQDPDSDPVDQYLYLTTREANARGFAPSYLKSRLYHIHTKTEMLSDTEAHVHLSGKTRKSICPFFSWVARIFFIGQTNTVETTLDLVKEDGAWKVCGAPFALGETRT